MINIYIDVQKMSASLRFIKKNHDTVAISHTFYGMWVFLSAAETPVIPSRFEVLADYNFSKVLLLHWNFMTHMPNVL